MIEKEYHSMFGKNADIGLAGKKHKIYEGVWFSVQEQSNMCM